MYQPPSTTGNLFGILRKEVAESTLMNKKSWKNAAEILALSPE
jgi:hypothetical protein